MPTTLFDTAKKTSMPTRILYPTWDKKQIRQGAVLGIADEFLYEIVRDEDCQGVVPSVSAKCTTEKDSRENVKYLNI